MKKGIILAGGTGSRLFPLTEVVSKQLMPVYDKPLIYYPLTTLILAGIRDVLIITSETYKRAFIDLLGHGDKFGINIGYEIQHEPNGLAEALIIGEEFLNRDPCALILGDNIFYGAALGRDLLTRCRDMDKGASVFAMSVPNPSDFGVVELTNGVPTSIVEKPSAPKSSLAVTGLYFFDGDAARRAGQLQPSNRGELEITDLNMSYLNDGLLNCNILGRGCAWFDTGTHESLFAAASFVRIVQEQQGLPVGSPDEAAFRMGTIDRAQLERRSIALKSSYGNLLYRVLESNHDAP